ncbi:MAG TPA: hypothetical protein VHB70_11280 [Parafilimonas sp.]|nr:hypothetical protein [Parafilimonas sp.]
MRTRIVYSFFVALIFLGACRKSDAPELPSNLQRAPIPQFKIDSSADLTISGQDPTKFSGKFTLSQYYATDHSFKSMDVVIRKSGDNSKIEVLQADITELPATFTITGDQLEKLFNAPIESTDFFDIGADVTLTNGAKVEAFPSDGNPNYDPNINTLPNLGPFTIQYGVFCNYVPSVYDGNFVVVEDDWADYHPGDVVPVTKIDDTHFSFEYAAADAKPIVVTVDPITNITSIDKVEFGNYGPGTGNFYAQSVSSPNNYVLPCQGVFSVVFDIQSDVLGDYGAIRVVMRKQ